MTEIDWSKHKYCVSCKTVHPITHFYRDRNAPTGYMKKCKTCTNASKPRKSSKPYQPRQGYYLNPETGLKKCASCLQDLPKTSFHSHPTTADRLNKNCRDCISGKFNTEETVIHRLDPQTGMKQCCDCGQTHLAANFFTAARNADGLTPRCKPCHRKRYTKKTAPQPKKPKPDPITYEPTDLKECKECGETLPRTEFYKEARNKDGLNTRCKTCFNKRYHQKETMKKQTYDLSSPVKTCNTCGETKDKSEFYSAPSNADGLMHRCKSCHKEHLNSKKAAKAKTPPDDKTFVIKTTGAKSYRGWVYLLTEKSQPEYIYLYSSKQDSETLLTNLNSLTPDGDGWTILASRESNSTENLWVTLFHYLSQEFPNYVGFGFAVSNTDFGKTRFLEAFNYYADCYIATVSKQSLPTRVTPSSEGYENSPSPRLGETTVDSTS